MAHILSYKDQKPKLGEGVFVAVNAAVVGDVTIGDKTNIWYGVQIRGDVNTVRIGQHTNIQDGTVCHVTSGSPKGKLTIGSYVTIGHNATVHACTIEDHAFVGMGATVLDGAVVESYAMLAAGALLTNNKRVPTGEVWAGNPAKFFRKMTTEEKDYITWSAQHYVKLGQEHAKCVSV